MKGHKNVSVLVSCIDFRFWPQALPVLQKKYGALDLIVLAGGAKNIASPLEKEDKTAIMENIGISIKLHNAKKIILTNHADCGAYGGSSKFKSSAEEQSFHIKELVKAKKIIRKHFPRHKIETIFIAKEGNRVKLHFISI